MSKTTITTPSPVLVTGATSGIGRRVATKLVAAGHEVVATGRAEPALAELRAGDDTGRLHVLPLDVTDGASVAAAVRACDRALGGRPVRTLVNNAGYSQPGPIEQIREADMRALFETNVFGLVAVTQAFLPGMRAAGGGRVINVSSVLGRMVMPFLGMYSATKYAVEALTDALRVEVAPFGVEVVLVEPGPVRTAFADRARDQLAPYVAEESPYRPVYARLEEILQRMLANAAPADLVADRIVEVVAARRPKPRYVVPPSQRRRLFLMSKLPTRATDRMKTRILGLDALASPPARAEGRPS